MKSSFLSNILQKFIPTKNEIKSIKTTHFNSNVRFRDETEFSPSQHSAVT